MASYPLGTFFQVNFLDANGIRDSDILIVASLEMSRLTKNSGISFYLDPCMLFMSVRV